MSLIPLKNKKEGDIRPYSTNPIFSTPIDAQCGYCFAPGRKKHYPTLWNLYLHVTLNHSMESYNGIFQDYAKKIMSGERKL